MLPLSLGRPAAAKVKILIFPNGHAEAMKTTFALRLKLCLASVLQTVRPYCKVLKLGVNICAWRHGVTRLRLTAG
jgi:hypothetical protein